MVETAGWWALDEADAVSGGACPCRVRPSGRPRPPRPTPHSAPASRSSFPPFPRAQNGQILLLLILITTAIVILVAFYLSIMLWRYGTKSSDVLHSSICNP